MKSRTRSRKTASRNEPGPSSMPNTWPAHDEGRTQIMIVDDHPMTREGLAHLINKQADLQVCCEASDAEEAFQKLARGEPDLVITDMTMPGRSGTEFIKDLATLFPGTPVLVVSMHDEQLYAERALRAGARGYIMKEAGGEKMLEAIRFVLSGKAYVSQRLASTMLDNFAARPPRGSRSPIGKLSDREFEVFQLIGQGKSTRQIAVELHLSPKTVDTHRGHIKDKLQLGNTTTLIRHAVRWVETET